jgi:hypothetical protein
MKIHLPAAVASRVALVSAKTQQNSPHLLFGAGIVLMGATVVTACVATLKVEKVLDEHKQHVDWADQNAESQNVDARKEKAVAYAVTARKLTVLYGPSVVCGIGSVVCLTQSHRILHKRNVALTAAYAGLDKAFKKYRERVADEIGEEREREVYADVETVKSKVDGKKVETKKASGKGGSPYARFFDEHNRNWDTNGDYRVGFLRLQQNWLNDQLNAKDIVFLNEAYDVLGLPRTEAGQHVGWVSKKHNESVDGYIDFGVFTDRSSDEYYAFAVNGEGIWLDFNVDGIVSDLLKKI